MLTGSIVYSYGVMTFSLTVSKRGLRNFGMRNEKGFRIDKTRRAPRPFVKGKKGFGGRRTKIEEL